MRTLCIIITVIVATAFAAGSIDAGQDKLNNRLKLLRTLREEPAVRARLAGTERNIVEAENAVVTVKFDHVLSNAEIETYRRMGVSFFDLDGEPARTGSIYPARIPWPVLDAVSGRIEVLRIEGNWHPAIYPLLDVSAHEIEADSVWSYTDPMGYPLTGKGMRIADFDTGIDVFHPSFFFADGDTFDWIDRDGFGFFVPGYDAVDLNRNGVYDTGELLDYFDGWIYDPAHVWGSGNPSNYNNGFQAYWDWLYNDANGNGDRDYGTGAGYTESDPTFGELLFILLDNNGNGSIEPGEKLVALNTSKIYATMNENEIERVRGSDLINSDLDDYGHGTPVSGILAGGTPGYHLFTGIAPDAEILMGYFFSDLPISLLIPWARSRGADVMLYEFGGFVYHYLDGSSLEEELISTENETIIQITPSGNLARGNKHAIAAIAAADSVVLQINVPTYEGYPIEYLYSTTLWRTSIGDLTFRLRSPLGGQITLTVGTRYVDGFYIWTDASVSPRGTCEVDVYVWDNANPDCLGIWELTVINTTFSEIEIISNIADNLSSWAGGAEFTNYATDDRNVTWPATADSSFCNGSYSTRGFEGYNGVGSGTILPGEISAFSGRGTRIDGKHLLDICSPGNYDVYSTRTHQDGSGYTLGSYRQFSGTSAAGPHVAAAAAIVQQAFPFATMGEVEYLLASHAAMDEHTGDVYNDTWGYGKLRILGAAGIASAVEDMAVGAQPPKLLLDQNYPNPFNPTTWIPFYLPSDGKVSIRIYNVKGELVKTLRDKWMSSGAHSVLWQGNDAKGRPAASGLYFCQLKFAGETQTRKLILLR